MIRRGILSLGKVACAAFFFLVCLELSLRLFNFVRPTWIFPTFSYNRFRGKPYSKDYDFKLNSQGFKDIERTKRKSPGVYRIVGIGDSFVFGVVPHRQNFLTVLERKIAESGARTTEVVKMGIPSTGVDHYYGLLVNEGLRYAPDMVIIHFFVGNDFTDRAEHGSSLYIFSLMKFLRLMAFCPGQVIHRVSQYHDDKPSMDDARFLRTERNRCQIFIKENPEFAQEMAYILDYLKKIRDVCSSRKIRLLVAIIPDEIQVNGGLQSRVVEAVVGERFRGRPLRREDFDFDLPQRRLHAELQALGINYVDMLDDFVRQTQKQRCYKPNDTHWNIAGNELAARALFNAIMPLLPPRK